LGNTARVRSHFDCFFRGVWESALAAAFFPRGLVFFRASALPAELAAFFPVEAFRPVCESALPAADFEAFVLLGFLSTRAAAVAARSPVRLSFLDAIRLNPLKFVALRG
jgi:hypothetical protein